MNTMSSTSQLEKLPVEVTQAILCALPDVASLKATALTCLSLYHAFVNAEDLIIGQVVLNEIDIDVLPEAIVALKSKDVVSPVSVWTDIKAFISDHLQNRLPTTMRWDMHKALHLTNLHKHIEFFATDFAIHTLAIRGPISSPPSREEINRIKRAFYRFEIYRNLFSKRGYFKKSSAFFSCFSVWENEQLACIHEFLFRVAAPVFNDLAEHDVQWGHYEIRPAAEFDCNQVQYILSLGLSKLFHIMTAETYEEQHNLIYLKSPRSKQFLSRGLKAGCLRSNIGPFSGHVLDVGNPFVISSFYEDPDPGPVDAYSWAHRGESQMGEFVASTKRMLLREWGYVMWDRARLDEMDVLDCVWPLSFVHSQENDNTDLVAEEAMLLDSWKRRHLIYKAGGRGWWSHQDESQVEWPRDWSPWDDEEKRKKCPLCIRGVFCAPHNLKLRVDSTPID